MTRISRSISLTASLENIPKKAGNMIKLLPPLNVGDLIMG